MNEPTGLAQQARALAKSAQEVKSAPFLVRAEMASALVDRMAEFLVEMAERVDRITPYLDEREGSA
ncbi:hypothetical protein SAMN06297129_2437 [Pseudooceanicola antarcticus]|uniref:Uncharacterized protein n=1 Tax=Pseudooceanicola antarcticus TaxID=1247613 RepID=A0A285IY46_9RHOB|nr:hypothetical protein [Pseudooceanicola antarcticus]PJE25773.1 hypothetical protein CVM39_18890 [Pseudooceanicola antarcticus]SNY52902.1 hypothetical protein SAMN06297129_2437 [Pseudooceanicola antarcticus]